MSSDEGLMQIIVTGVGRVITVPDQATARLGIAVIHPDLGEARNQADATMHDVISALLGAGIEQRDLQTEQYTIERERDWENRNRYVGYSVRNQLTVTIRDVDRAGELIERACDAGANDVGNLQFSMSDQVPALDAARAAAMDDARRKAEQLAQHGGVTLGLPLKITETQVGTPRHEMTFAAERSMASIAPPPIEAGEITTSVQVTVIYAIHH